MRCRKPMTELEAFDKYAPEYDDWFEGHHREYALELRAIREFIPKGGVGIEIGAGTGRFTQPLEISLGIEPSAGMRNIALNRGVNVIAGTAESIPVESGSYDFALLVTTLCFLESPEIAFNEVYRVLKDKGFIIIGMIDKDSRLGRKYKERRRESKFYRNAKFHSVVEVQEMLKKAGFSNFAYLQVMLPGDFKEEYEPEVKQGYGKGSFVVLRAQKYSA